MMRSLLLLMLVFAAPGHALRPRKTSDGEAPAKTTKGISLRGTEGHTATPKIGDASAAKALEREAAANELDQQGQRKLQPSEVPDFIITEVADPVDAELRFVEIFKRSTSCASESNGAFDDDLSPSSNSESDLDVDDPFFGARYLSRSKSVMDGDNKPTEADTIVVVFSDNDFINADSNLLLVCKNKAAFEAAFCKTCDIESEHFFSDFDGGVRVTIQELRGTSGLGKILDKYGGYEASSTNNIDQSRFEVVAKAVALAQSFEETISEERDEDDVNVFGRVYGGAKGESKIGESDDGLRSSALLGTAESDDEILYTDVDDAAEIDLIELQGVAYSKVGDDDFYSTATFNRAGRARVEDSSEVLVDIITQDLKSVARTGGDPGEDYSEVGAQLYIEGDFEIEAGDYVRAYGRQGSQSYSVNADDDELVAFEVRPGAPAPVSGSKDQGAFKIESTLSAAAPLDGLQGSRDIVFGGNTERNGQTTEAYASEKSQANLLDSSSSGVYDSGDASQTVKAESAVKTDSSVKETESEAGVTSAVHASESGTRAAFNASLKTSATELRGQTNVDASLEAAAKSTLSKEVETTGSASVESGASVLDPNLKLRGTSFTNLRGKNYDERSGSETIEEIRGEYVFKAKRDADEETFLYASATADLEGSASKGKGQVDGNKVLTNSAVDLKNLSLGAYDTRQESSTRAWGAAGQQGIYEDDERFEIAKRVVFFGDGLGDNTVDFSGGYAKRLCNSEASPSDVCPNFDWNPADWELVRDVTEIDSYTPGSWCGEARPLTTCAPTPLPSNQPTGQPSSKPSSEPSSLPSGKPTGQPSSKPSSEPSSLPSGQPTGQPSSKPSNQPSSQPSSHPTAMPSAARTPEPTPELTAAPTPAPTPSPTAAPTAAPTSAQTAPPTACDVCADNRECHGGYCEFDVGGGRRKLRFGYMRMGCCRR